jgi:hypothetical protein
MPDFCSTAWAPVGGPGRLENIKVELSSGTLSYLFFKQNEEAKRLELEFYLSKVFDSNEYSYSKGLGQ